MDELLRERADSLLKSAGFRSANDMTRLSGGRNNRTYRLDTSDGPVLLKHYFQGGDWDRCRTESRFLAFCGEFGVGRTPKLLAEDAVNGLALHSWVDGKRLAPDSVTEHDIREVAAFLTGLGEAWRSCGPSRMSPARDAALCLEDFFRSPRERLAQLRESLVANPDGPMAAEALAFFEKELWPAWRRANETVLARLAAEDPFRPFPLEELTVSPSDIGFHNALRSPGGGLVFLDFEYGGVDSLIKAWGDFICQADYAVDSGEAVPLLPPAAARRLSALLPLVRIKFCCIVLNIFKSSGEMLRWHGAAHGEAAHFSRRLAKARQCLEHVRMKSWRTIQ